MATLVRRVFKVALFVSLFCLAVPYVHTYPWPMPESQSAIWWGVSRWLDIRDPEDLYFVVWVTIDLLVAALVYLALMRLWRHYRAKQ
ncbi:hypothetical protein GXB81_01690 [Paraburkholderia sp. Ac-20336]|uniref:hypothetical protein n=1 Tax=unclassified Paraburkholderia TaxID=2615204 RepID=UPI00141F80EB|nr:MULTISPECIES: hypothetical protein [unclassified Paraburkholderia]MBN3801775.1 hypothetical protein [Paraburkholderia sp. Ac-20336]NIF75843.1 hypothetical protein [Paraburkholderia sp. Cy-641]